MKTYLPFEIKYSPVQKLALISFENCPETFYRVLELQYIDGEPYGTGYRVIAYRNDNYVDVYDDKALNFMEDEKFDVVENGLHKHVQTDMKNVLFSKKDNKQVLSFEFSDIENRLIKLHIEETSDKRTCPMNMLAPIGMGTRRPNYLPVFFMYEFDFIRRNDTVKSCNIAGNEIMLDTFPLPMGGQPRIYTRYSNECELFEFANTDFDVLKEVELDDNNTYRDDNVEYIFENGEALQKIIIHFKENDVQIQFNPSLNLKKNGKGEIRILPREQMGYLQGTFEVQVLEETKLTMNMKGGWKPDPNSFVTKMLLNKKSIFCNWSKKYQYESVINWDMKSITADWINYNLEDSKK